MRRLINLPLIAALVAGAVVPLAPATAAARRAVPTPAVSGPVTGGLKGHAFNSALREPHLPAFSQYEYFIHGTATAYDVSPTVFGATAAPARFTTRILVRRPSPARFNGTVVVEWLNDTSGYDVDAAWADMRREILRDGFAYVGVTAQPVGVAGLKAYDRKRYRSLLIPSDEYSYDIYSQAIQAVLHSKGTNPLGTLHPTHVIATGDSQSGTALDHYVTDVLPLVQPIVDGFLVVTAADAVGKPAVPVMQVLSEEEVARAPKQAPSATFRQWQVAGASHTDKNQSDYLRATQNRDWGMPHRVDWPLAPSDVPGPDGDCLMGRFPKYLAEDAALAGMQRWITTGTPPHRAPRIKVRHFLIKRNHNGNAHGGLRLPAIDVPTASYYGDATNECGPTLGKTEPFTLRKLYRRYPTHDGYVARVKEAVRTAEAAGYLLPADGDDVMTAARRSFIGE